jgi:cysteine desulfurase
MPTPAVYVDCNASAPLRPRARAAMIEACDRFGARGVNPSSPHHPGHEARLSLESSRETVARLLGAPARCIVFVSGGTEADNLAVQGAARAWAASRGGPGRIVTSAVEHPAVLEPCRWLAGEGGTLALLPVDAQGRVDAEAARREMGPDVALVSVMLANNETGVLQPAAEIAREARARGIPSHVDAVQAAGRVAVDVEDLGADFVSVSSHKIGGPVGIGALYVREGASLRPLMFGGGQERRRRPGTEPVALAAGFAAAAEEALPLASVHAMAALRDRLERRVLSEIPGARVNGAGAPRLPNTSSLSFPGVDNEALVIRMDLRGFALSTGSACSTGASRPSHVLEAMGLSPDDARATVRVSLGPDNTAEEIEALATALREEVARRPSRADVLRETLASTRPRP